VIIQQSNWLTRARKAAGGKGPAQAELGDDLVATVQVADLDQPEYDSLGGVRQFSFGFSQVGVAANLSFGSIFNPVGSGILAIIHRIAYSAGAVGVIQESRLSADTGGGQVSVRPTDFRYSPNDGPSSICRIGVQGAVPGDPVGSTISVVGNIENQPEWPRWYVCPPGTGLVIFLTTVNVAIRGVIWFKERAAEGGELQLGT